MDYQEVCFESEVVKLPVVQDPVTGAKYLRLNDIHDIFPAVHRILLDDMIVPFMVDSDEIKYEPKRVAHHPGRILQLVAPAPPTPSTPLPQYSAVDNQHFQHPQQAQQHPYCPPPLPTGETVRPSPRQQVLQRSQTLLRVIEQQLHPHGPHTVLPDTHPALLPEAFVSATTTTIQTRNDTPILAAAPERFTGARVSAHLYRELQQGMVELRQLMGHNHDEVLENFLEVLKRQQQTLDRIALLQKRMEANISQVYELHEYPIPRLFIILPDPRHRWDPRRLLSSRFRLHFLCECGQHTQELVRDDPVLSRQPHHIHLAHHSGYELTRPSEFFDQYGPYLLGMLQMIKFGCMVAGLVIHPVAHLPIAENLDKLSQTVHSMSKDLVAGIDTSIQYLERHLQLADPIAIHDRLSELSALEGADLRRLEHFIRHSDQGKTLGNLYRLTTLSGHVKWVCLDHYRSNYRESAMRQLLQTVEVQGGVYDPHLQKVVITLNSATVAAQLMDRLVCAPGVDELELTLDYDFGSADLSQLRQVLRTCSVQSLTLDGNWRKGPLVEIKLPGRRRFDGLAGLLAHERLRSLKLRRLLRFGATMSASALAPVATALVGNTIRGSSSGSNNSIGGPTTTTSIGGMNHIGGGDQRAIVPPPPLLLRPNAVSYLRVLHFLQKMDHDDQSRLVAMIQGSPSLVDLRLGLPNHDLELDQAASHVTVLHQPLLDAIATLPYLKVLHLHMIYMRQPTDSSQQALRQIASYKTLQECKVLIHDAFGLAAQFSVLTQHPSLTTFQLQALARWRVGHFEKMQTTSASRRHSSVHLDFPDHAMTPNEIQAVQTILSGFKLSYLSIAMPTDLNAPSRAVVIPLQDAIDHGHLTSVRFSRLARGVHHQFWVAYFDALEKQRRKDQQQQKQERQTENKLTGAVEALSIQDKEKARLSLHHLHQAIPSALPATASPFRRLKSISLVQAHISAHLLQHIGQLSLCQLTLFYCSIEDVEVLSTKRFAMDATLPPPPRDTEKPAATLIRNLDYSRLRLLLIVELGMDAGAVDAFWERVDEYRRDLEVYVYDTEWTNLEVERLSAPVAQWPRLGARTGPRSPQVAGEEGKDEDEEGKVESDGEEESLSKQFSMCARNRSNFDPKELNLFYAKMRLY